MNIDDFMDSIHPLTSMSKLEEDMLIIKKINNWRKKCTPTYVTYIKNGGHGIGYLAHMYARAGVDRYEAYQFVDDRSQEIDGCMEDFINEYNSTPYDETFRMKVLL